MRHSYSVSETKFMIDLIYAANTAAKTQNHKSKEMKVKKESPTKKL